MRTEHVQVRDKYVKVPIKLKMMIVRKIIFEKQPIKYIAKLFGIKYPTVKTFLRQYRKNAIGFSKEDLFLIELNNISHQQKIENTKQNNRCSYRTLNEKKETNTEIQDFRYISSSESQKSQLFLQNSADFQRVKEAQTYKIQIFSSISL